MKASVVGIDETLPAPSTRAIRGLPEFQRPGTPSGQSRSDSCVMPGFIQASTLNPWKVIPSNIPLAGKTGTRSRPSGPIFGRPGSCGLAEGRDLAEALNHQSQLANRRHGTGHDVLGPQRAGRRDALVAAGRVDPIAGGRAPSPRCTRPPAGSIPRPTPVRGGCDPWPALQGAVDVAGCRAGRRCQRGRHGCLPETGGVRRERDRPSS